MITYLDKVLYLYPTIQGVVFWQTQYDGTPFTDPYDGLKWENTEIAKPSKVELDALVNAVVETVLAARASVARKEARDAKYASDLTIISNYEQWKATNENKTFSEYLDFLESII